MATTAPAATPATLSLDKGFSVLAIGAVGARPLPDDLVTGASGSWMVTDFTGAAGIVIGFLHLGQGPERPANWSLTENRALQPAQTTWIAMAPPEQSEKKASRPMGFRR
jgi:hypothetical protein